MPASSSPSLPPTNPQMRLGTCARALRASSQGKRHLLTPPRVTFCKGRGNLLNKASALCERTGARAAVVVFCSKGKLYSPDDLSVEKMAETVSDYVRRNGGAMPPMGPEEGVDRVKKEGKSFSNRFTTLSKMASELCAKTDARAAVIVFSNTGSLYARGFPTVEYVISHWVEKKRASCVTEEDLDSLKLRYEPVLRYVMREKLKDIRGSGSSGVGVDRGSEVSKDDNFDSRAQGFEASHPVLFTDFEDHASDGFLTSPVNSAVARGSSGKEPMRSVVKAGAGGHSGVGVGHEIHPLLESFEASLSLLADFGNPAVAGGGLGVGSTSALPDPEGREFVNGFFDFSSGLDEKDCLIPPGNSTGHGGSSGAEQGHDRDPDTFNPLEDLDVSLEI